MIPPTVTVVFVEKSDRQAGNGQVSEFVIL
jgi:hypothetical protein